MTKQMKLAGIVVAVAAVVGGSLFMMRVAGESAGAAALERLELVWPDYMTMPAADRAVIAGLALQCGMDRTEKRADAVVACLQEAAGSDAPTFPKGITPEAGRRRLAELVERATKAPDALDFGTLRFTNAGCKVTAPDGSTVTAGTVAKDLVIPKGALITPECFQQPK